MDILTCKYQNITRRMDDSDIKTMIVWLSLMFITIIMSIFIHSCIIWIYIVSVAVLLIEFNRFREKNKKVMVKNTIEVVKCNVKDLQNTDVFVGRWRGKRPYMEDRFIVCPDTKIFGVWDGHGGSEAAKFIEQRFTTEYEDIFHNLLMNNNYSNIDTLTMTALEQTVIKMDRDLYRKNITSGAVGVVVKMNVDKIYCTSIGDSGAFIVMGDDTIKQISITHSLNQHDEYCRYTDTINPLRPKISTVMRTYSGMMPTRTVGDHTYKKRDKGLINIPETTVTSIIKPVVPISNSSSDRFDTIHSHDPQVQEITVPTITLGVAPVATTNLSIDSLIPESPLSVSTAPEPFKNPDSNGTVHEINPDNTESSIEPMIGVDKSTDANDHNTVTARTVAASSRDWKMIILGSDGIWDCVDPKFIKDQVVEIMKNHTEKKDSETELHKNITKFMVKIHAMTVRESDMVDKLMCRYYGDNCTLMILLNNEMEF